MGKMHLFSKSDSKLRNPLKYIISTEIKLVPRKFCFHREKLKVSFQELLGQGITSDWSDAASGTEPNQAECVFL